VLAKAGWQMRCTAQFIYFILFSFLQISTACRPEPKGNIALSHPPDSVTLKAAADSGNFFNQDGLDYEPLNTGTFDQLPTDLTTYLNRQSPGWTLPFISREYLQQTNRNPTGPYYVQADFNQDSIQDFAVQYQFKDTIYIKAFLKNQAGRLQEYSLAKYPFNGTDTKKESKLYLSLLTKGKEIIMDTVPEKRKLILPQNAVAVDSNNKIVLFYFNGQNFNPLNLK
jgi:hypothetical protein